MSGPNRYLFRREDFLDDLPPAGAYPGRIERADFRRSITGNRMLHVVYALEGVSPAYQLVADYFVLEGQAVSTSGILFARRRLVELYHACWLFPTEGEQIDPRRLLESRLQVRVQHESYNGRWQLRVVGYRALEPAVGTGDETYGSPVDEPRGEEDGHYPL
jgi:hypothetical protein